MRELLLLACCTDAGVLTETDADQKITTALRVPTEVWQNGEDRLCEVVTHRLLFEVPVFFHMKSEDDIDDMISCLTVCKHFHGAMTGRPLLDHICIQNSAQIPRLAAHLIEHPSRTRHIRVLQFCLSAILPSVGGEETLDVELTHDLAPIPFILQMCRHLTELFDLPLLWVDYSTITSLIRALPKLHSLSLTDWAVPVPCLLGTPDLHEIASLCHSMNVVENLYVQYFSLATMKRLCVRYKDNQTTALNDTQTDRPLACRIFASCT